MLLYVMRVRFLYFKKIFVGNFLLVRPCPFPDIFLQPAYRCMQVNNNIRLHKLLMNNIEQALVQPELIIGQIYAGK